MKVTYKVSRPLDGQGTLINPAYKWFESETTEFCEFIMKAGNSYYMMRGGYVFHSIDVEDITKIVDCGKVYQSYKDWHNDRFGTD